MSKRKMGFVMTGLILSASILAGCGSETVEKDVSPVEQSSQEEEFGYVMTEVEQHLLFMKQVDEFLIEAEKLIPEDKQDSLSNEDLVSLSDWVKKAESQQMLLTDLPLPKEVEGEYKSWVKKTDEKLQWLRLYRDAYEQQNESKRELAHELRDKSAK